MQRPKAPSRPPCWPLPSAAGSVPPSPAPDMPSSNSPCLPGAQMRTTGSHSLVLAIPLAMLHLRRRCPAPQGSRLLLCQLEQMLLKRGKVQIARVSVTAQAQQGR